MGIKIRNSSVIAPDMKAIKRFPKAILLDYDGVLASTPEYNYQAWQEAFSNEGAEISRREYFLMEGMGPHLISQMLCQVHGVSSEKSLEIMMRKENLMSDTAAQASIYQGIPEMLYELCLRGVRLALVTGASKKRLDQFLPNEIRKFFENLITSDDVVQTKPNPEPYLKAAMLLGVVPEEAIVIENAPLGIKSAKKGGFYCIALKTTLEQEDLKEANIICNDHDELYRILLS